MRGSNIEQVVLNDIHHGGYADFERVHWLLDYRVVEGPFQPVEGGSLFTKDEPEAGKEFLGCGNHGYLKFIARVRSRSRGIWLESEPSLWPGSSYGTTLNICLIILSTRIF